MWKGMDFYILLKTWVKVEVINMVKNFLILLKGLKIALKRAIQKTAEATGDLIGNKIADKITSVSKKSDKVLPNDEIEEEVEITSIKNNTYLQKKENKLLMN